MKAAPVQITKRGVNVRWQGNPLHPTAIPVVARGPGKQTGGPMVVLQAWTVQLQLAAVLGPAGGLITGGYGSWEAVAIPRGEPLTQWTGRTAITMDLDLLMNGWHAQRSIESDIATLEAMATLRPAMLTPPSLRLFGPVPHVQERWVISDLTWADAIRDTATGNRLRQAVMVHLMAYKDPVSLAAVPKGTASVSPPRKYKVKAGDDLKRIATALLGRSSKWPQIAAANPGLRGWQIPHSWVGKTIKVPPR